VVSLTNLLRVPEILLRNEVVVLKDHDALPVSCAKFFRENHYSKQVNIYFNFIDGKIIPNICDDGDDSAECIECLKSATEQYIKEHS